MSIPGREDGDPPPHLTNLMLEFLRGQQSVLRALGQVTTQLGEVRADSRVSQRVGHVLREEMIGVRADMTGFEARFRDILTRLDGYEARFEGIEAEIVALRAEMIRRFEAVGTRFDGQDAAIERLERAVGEVRADIAGLEIGIVNAVHAAMDAHRRLDERGNPP